ncbi:MAG: glucose-6-phosphate isomerase [Deltaproteobacteria bacterium]|jgi:glucose-6-phosphate isomerase|nr:glucose-6-phosphate isomerase [Deltaproteobacteria bacterium]
MPDKKPKPPVKEEPEDFLTLDYNNVTSEALGAGKGLGPEDLAEMKAALGTAFKDIEARYRKGLLPFMDLPRDPDVAKASRKLAEMGRKRFETVVVLGIGGSALGASAVFNALRPLNHNDLPPAKRGWPRLIVCDNIDPEGFAAVLEGLDLKNTFFNVISKSGATAETMSQFMIVFDQLQRTLGRSAIKEHLLITTDPEGGVLRKLADQGDFNSLPVPPGVGGRYSVLSAVGIAPLAMAGVNITDLLAGAARAQEDARKPPSGNKAYVFAGLNYMLTTAKKRNILVMMPYSDGLSRTGEWFGQLWNESLGKSVRLDGSPNPWSQTAVKALGVTDQHSQLQMYMEGTDEKTICFLGVDAFRHQVNIPSIFKDFDELSYLGGRNLGELMASERQGVARALTESGRPNMTLSLPKISAATVGYLLQTLEVAAVVSGSLYQINPLDQPGVELGKQFTYGLMGRQGYASFKDRYAKGLSVKKKFILK